MKGRGIYMTGEKTFSGRPDTGPGKRIKVRQRGERDISSWERRFLRYKFWKRKGRLDSGWKGRGEKGGRWDMTRGEHSLLKNVRRKRLHKGDTGARGKKRQAEETPTFPFQNHRVQRKRTPQREIHGKIGKPREVQDRFKRKGGGGSMCLHIKTPVELQNG